MHAVLHAWVCLRVVHARRVGRNERMVDLLYATVLVPILVAVVKERFHGNEGSTGRFKLRNPSASKLGHAATENSHFHGVEDHVSMTAVALFILAWLTIRLCQLLQVRLDHRLLRNHHHPNALALHAYTTRSRLARLFTHRSSAVEQVPTRETSTLPQPPTTRRSASLLLGRTDRVEKTSYKRTVSPQSNMAQADPTRHSPGRTLTHTEDKPSFALDTDEELHRTKKEKGTQTEISVQPSRVQHALLHNLSIFPLVDG